METPPTPSKPKRRFLRFSLRTFLLVTLVLSLALGTFGRAWLKAYRDSQPPTLYELAQIAKRHGIPMPPKEAKLVLGITSNDWSNVHIYRRYAPAFLLPSAGDRLALLQGAQELDCPDRPWAWKEFSLREARNNTAGYSLDLSPHYAFLCAVQAYEHGERDQAAVLLRALLEQRADPVTGSNDSIVDPADLRLTMGRSIFRQLALKIKKQPDRWAEVREELEALQEEFPKLRDENCGGVCQDLSAALDAPAPAPNSVEALLIDWSHRDGDTGWPPFSMTPWDNDESRVIHNNNALAREIVLRGFAAVPELIALRDDHRLTAHSRPFGFEESGTPTFLRLGDLACDLLSEISGFRTDWGRGLSVTMSDEETNPSTEAWRKWFVQAQEQGEREYLVHNLYARSTEGNELRTSIAFILAGKYPEELPELCKDCFHRKHATRDAFEFAVAEANLPKEARIELLIELYNRAPRTARTRILCALAKVNVVRTTELVLPLLAESPVDVDEPYEACFEAHLPDVVNRLNDPRAWQSLLQAARRATIPLRVEMLLHVTHHNQNKRNRPYQMALLAAFLDDESLRDVSMNPDKSIGSSGQNQISVRDFAADALADLLDLERDYTYLTPEKGTKLRDQVRERLKGEKLPELD